LQPRFFVLSLSLSLSVFFLPIFTDNCNWRAGKQGSGRDRSLAGSLSLPFLQSLVTLDCCELFSSVVAFCCHSEFLSSDVAFLSAELSLSETRSWILQGRKGSICSSFTAASWNPKSMANLSDGWFFA
jgi:hypothetical protein